METIILYLIQGGYNRFSQLQVKMPRISKKILAEQLKEMEADGLITREEIKSKEPKIVIYSLSAKGESLRSLIETIIDWSLEFEKDFINESIVSRA
jgi:DNA-binding HxlR family transcriptional regulator